MNQPENPTGLWLPLVTPFRAGAIDSASLRRLISHYATRDISGFILAATTGEGQLLSAEELEQLVRISAEELSRLNTPQKLYLGMSGSDPSKVRDELQRIANWPVDGYLISGPNYLRPAQRGLLAYYRQIAQCTEKPIILYNIPYRTGVNIENETMLELAELPNIVGVKDCCGNVQQSYEFIRMTPKTFSVLTGEDPFFYNAMVHGAAGAILTGAHVLADVHLEIMKHLRNGNQTTALEKWNAVVHVPGLLFSEPSPAPLKYWLNTIGLIDEAEVRLPFVPVGEELATKLSSAIN